MLLLLREQQHADGNENIIVARFALAFPTTTHGKFFHIFAIFPYHDAMFGVFHEAGTVDDAKWAIVAGGGSSGGFGGSRDSHYSGKSINRTRVCSGRQNSRQDELEPGSMGLGMTLDDHLLPCRTNWTGRRIQRQDPGTGPRKPVSLLPLQLKRMCVSMLYLLSHSLTHHLCCRFFANTTRELPLSTSIRSSGCRSLHRSCD